MTRKKLSRAAKVRNMLDKNIKPKDIAEALKMPVQTVYNIRYQYNKKKGIGALPKPPRSESSAPIVVPPFIREEKQAARVEVPTDAFNANTFPWWWVALACVGVLAIFIVK